MLATILLIIIGVLLVILIGLILLRPKKSAALPESLDNLRGNLQQINEHLRALTGGQGESKSSQRRLEDDLKKALQRIDTLQAHLEERHKQEEEKAKTQIESLKRLEGTLLGSKSAGILGENIVRDQMKKILPDWVVSNFKIGSSVVEFGFRLFDGRIIPIDSKIVAIDKVRQLPEAETAKEREPLSREINHEMGKKIKEVSRYIDPKTTYHKAIVTVPDAVYGILDMEVFADATRSNVLVLPYSMLVPFLLTILDLERKSQSTLSQQRMQVFLSNLRKNLVELRGLMDDSIARGNKMISNAYERITAILGSIEVNLESLEASKEEIEELAKIV